MSNTHFSEGTCRLAFDAFPAEAESSCTGGRTQAPKGFSLSVYNSGHVSKRLPKWPGSTQPTNQATKQICTTRATRLFQKLHKTYCRSSVLLRRPQSMLVWWQRTHADMTGFSIGSGRQGLAYWYLDVGAEVARYPLPAAQARCVEGSKLASGASFWGQGGVERPLRFQHRAQNKNTVPRRHTDSGKRSFQPRRMPSRETRRRVHILICAELYLTRAIRRRLAREQPTHLDRGGGASHHLRPALSSLQHCP